jgi:transposase InsO family protein
VWALDFAFDQTADGRVLKVLTVTDEFTKIALAIEVERSITGDDLVRVLDRLVAVHGCPQFIRIDNGPEMTCNAIADWCRFSPTGSVFIEPGSPWQNAFVESFNGELRDERLAIERFHALLEAKVMAEDYRRHYNTYRPHSSLESACHNSHKQRPLPGGHISLLTNRGQVSSTHWLGPDCVLRVKAGCQRSHRGNSHRASCRNG